MSVKTTASTAKKIKVLLADTPFYFTGTNQAVDVEFIFTSNNVVPVVIKDVNSEDQLIQTPVPSKRLVFNGNQIKSGSLTVNPNGSFTNTQETCIGYYFSANHDGIIVTVPCVLSITTRTNTAVY